MHRLTCHPLNDSLFCGRWQVYHAFHGPGGEKFLKHRKKAGTYDWVPPTTTRDYLELGETFAKKGYFT